VKKSFVRENIFVSDDGGGVVRVYGDDRMKIVERSIENECE
jgi:hypothetical protein